LSTSTVSGTTIQLSANPASRSETWSGERAGVGTREKRSEGEGEKRMTETVCGW